MGNGVDMVAQS